MLSRRLMSDDAQWCRNMADNIRTMLALTGADETFATIQYTRESIERFDRIAQALTEGRAAQWELERRRNTASIRPREPHER
jgi:hypothetical protein